MLAQPFHVRDQVPGRVVIEAGVRRALAAAALIEQYDAVLARIPEAALDATTAAAWSAVYEQRRLAVGVAVLLVVDLVRRIDGESSAVERLGFLKQGPQRFTHGNRRQLTPNAPREPV